MPRRRRKLDRSVLCRIALTVGGRTVKTCRRRLSFVAALREIARDPVGVEGQLRSGQGVTLSRRINPAVRVTLTYTADNEFESIPHVGEFSLNTSDAVTVIGAHLAG
jgi:hypothetical protein